MLLMAQAPAGAPGFCSVNSAVLSTTLVCAEAPPAVLTRANVNVALKGRRWSGLVVDTSTIQLATGPVGPGDPLLKVKVRQGFTARLATKFQGRGLGGVEVAPGGLVYGSSYRFSVVNARTRAETWMSRDTFLWCAPVAFKKGAAAPDRAMCFVDEAQPNRIRIGPVPLDANKSYNFVLSKKGQSANAPAELEQAASMGGRKPVTEPTDQPYPDAFDLVISWRKTGDKYRLEAEALDAGGRSLVGSLPLDSADVVDVFGGKLELQRSSAGWTPRFTAPPTHGALIAFSPDRSER